MQGAPRGPWRGSAWTKLWPPSRPQSPLGNNEPAGGNAHTLPTQGTEHSRRGGVSFFQSVFSVCPIRASMLPHSLTTGKELEKRGPWKRGREKASRDVHLWPETAAGASWPLRGWESQTFLGGLAWASGGDFFPATGYLKHSCFPDP